MRERKHIPARRAHCMHVGIAVDMLDERGARHAPGPCTHVVGQELQPVGLAPVTERETDVVAARGPHHVFIHAHKPLGRRAFSLNYGEQTCLMEESVFGTGNGVYTICP